MLRLYFHLRIKRKRHQLQLMLMRHIILEKPYSCSIWVKPRSQSFWNETMINYWDEDDWIKNMRMSKEAFDYLCTELSLYISKEDTKFRKCI